MKLITRIGVPALILLLVLAAATENSQSRIGTIDLHRVFEKYGKREQAQAVFNETKDSLDKELKAMMDDFSKTREEYTNLQNRATDPSVTAEEREKRKREAENKYHELVDRDKALGTYQKNEDEQLSLKMQHMMDALIDDIRKVAVARARTAGYSMVIDVSAESFNQSHTPVILYSTGDNDMTDAVLKQLNAAAPENAANSPDKPDPVRK